MTPLLVVVLMWAVTYPTRLLGLSLGGLKLPPFWLSVLKYVPVSVIAALITPELLGSAEWPRRVVGALVAGALLWRTRNLALGILGGFAAYWLARVLGL